MLREDYLMRPQHTNRAESCPRAADEFKRLDETSEASPSRKPQCFQLPFGEFSVSDLSAHLNIHYVLVHKSIYNTGNFKRPVECSRIYLWGSLNSSWMSSSENPGSQLHEQTIKQILDSLEHIWKVFSQSSGPQPPVPGRTKRIHNIQCSAFVLWAHET